MRRLLVMGHGDVVLRMVTPVRGCCRVFGPSSHSHQHCAALRRFGVTPVRGDFDRPQALAALAKSESVPHRLGLPRPPRVPRGGWS